MGRNVTVISYQLKKYEQKTSSEPILESTAEDGTLPFYCAVLSAFRHFHGVSAHFIVGDEPL